MKAQSIILSLPHAGRAMVLLAAAAGCSYAGVISLSGTLNSPEDTAEYTVVLSLSGSLTIQTYGFGQGGFDPFVGLFQGTGSSAVFIDGTSDILTNYTAGCPPAATVTIGSVPNQCGDVRIQFSGLTPGTYTIVLSDAEYLPNALFETSPPTPVLGDGFTDLTGGVFQTCADSSDCITPTANWSMDILLPERAYLTPEPGTWALAVTALGGLVWRRRAARNH